MMKTSMPSHSMHSIPALRVCALFALAAALLVTTTPVRCADGTWVATGSLNLARGDHAATRLTNGKVLVVGGSSADTATETRAEIYDPATGQWTLTGALAFGRQNPTATLLNDGRVLVVGGDRDESSADTWGFLGTCELYDPTTGTWSPTGSLNTPREFFTATLLPNGEVLVAGGLDNADESLTSAEIYDPLKGTWRYTGSFSGTRWKHAATRLVDGKVLVVGGVDDDFLAQSIGSATVYDPVTGTWSDSGALSKPRAGATATLLATGDVLVSGGLDWHYLVSSALADRFDSKAHWSATGSMNAGRYAHTATLLPSGNVLVTGGYGYNRNVGSVLASAELYDPAAGTWRAAAGMRDARQGHTATLLTDGRVLVVGGGGPGYTLLASAEILQPANVPIGTITAAFTGAWYDPAQSGHGLFVEVLSGNRFLAGWFAFDPSGKQQAWFTGVGSYSGNTATITDVVLPTGGRFIPNFDAADVALDRWGSLTFTFTDCNHGRVAFNSVAGYGSGSMNITRLTQPAGLSCP